MEPQAKKLLIWAEKSAGARHMGAIPTHAAPYMVVHINDLDSDLFLLNVQNGTIVIRRLEDGSISITLKPHDPDDLISRLSPVTYDSRATCPTYDAALALVQPDAEIRSFLHRAVGYAATGDTSEQKLFFFCGGGRNGKSTFVDAWAYILGTYAATIPIETFLSGAQSRYAGQASPHLARLRAVRMLRTSEAEKDAVLAESFIKLATPNEPILVRELNQAFFELRPQFKLFIQGTTNRVSAGPMTAFGVGSFWCLGSLRSAMSCAIRISRTS
jgi:putative DNA primase/helicase